MEFPESARGLARSARAAAPLVMLCACVAGIVAVATFSGSQPPAQDIGADAAGYGRFLKEFADKPFAEQHIAAHRMGNALYVGLGIQGVGVCDPSFAFGCYHGFFGKAVAENGTGILPSLAEGCRTRYGDAETGCTHGIGHGLVEYLGSDKLLEALAHCDATGQRDELFGCTGGVFMEYNSAIRFDADSVRVERRVPEAGNLLAPCDSEVPERFRGSCYFEIPLWWKSVLNDDFDAVGNLCEKAALEQERIACWKGWGTVVAENVEYLPGKAADLCDLINNERGRGYCRIGVAMRFFGTGTRSEEGDRMCDGLDGSFRAECSALSPRAKHEI